MGAQTVAILVGGGPAPGINGVIASATIEAARCGMRVLGLYDGYRHIAAGDTGHVRELDAESVSRIHTTGGSILRTSRTNPAKDDATLRNCVRALHELGVTQLIAIGGDDTTYGALRIAQEAQGRLRVVTVPKTIDNDLPLPDDAPTFGFETARSVGTAIVENLIEDASTTTRWYFVISMGRKAGSLALGMCKAAGAHLAVIPEEFAAGEVDLDRVAATIAGSILKRKAAGHDDGVAVIAEGIAERIPLEQLAASSRVSRDSYGHIRLADVPLGVVLREAVEAHLARIGATATIVTKDVGYELRCAKPVPFDVEYTRSLGYGAARYLIEGGSGALIALSHGRVVPLSLSDLQDPATQRVRVRMVDVTTESYQVARNAMTRIEPDDLREPMLSRLASHTNVSPEDFQARYADIVPA